MSKYRFHSILLCLSFLFCVSDYGEARSVYVNGLDVSNATSQRMKNVEVYIDKVGNIFITAPQYEVIEENSFEPLSELAAGRQSQMPQHKKPQNMIPQETQEEQAAPTTEQNIEPKPIPASPARLEGVPTEPAGTP